MFNAGMAVIDELIVSIQDQAKDLTRVLGDLSDAEYDLRHMRIAYDSLQTLKWTSCSRALNELDEIAHFIAESVDELHEDRCDILQQITPLVLLFVQLTNK